MKINFELYKVFYVVAKELNFSKAAKALYLSQSAVSQSISNLEKALSTKLFNRSTKKVALTKEGEILLEHVEPAVNSFLKGEKQLKDMHDLKRGILHIGVSDTICKYYLIDYLSDFHKLYPDIEILITNRTSIQCVDLLKKNQVDMILTNLPNEEIDSTLSVQEIKTFSDIVIAPKTYEELVQPHIPLASLLDYPILLLDRQSATTRFLSQVFDEQGLRLKPSVELGSIDLLIEMASIGLGITFIPDYVFKNQPGLMVVNTSPLPERRLGIVTNKNTAITNAARSFISLFNI